MRWCAAPLGSRVYLLPIAQEGRDPRGVERHSAGAACLRRGPHQRTIVEAGHDHLSHHARPGPPLGRSRADQVKPQSSPRRIPVVAARTSRTAKSSSAASISTRSWSGVALRASARRGTDEDARPRVVILLSLDGRVGASRRVDRLGARGHRCRQILTYATDYRTSRAALIAFGGPANAPPSPLQVGDVTVHQFFGTPIPTRLRQRRASSLIR